MSVSWRGVFPAICTQFKSDYSLDIPATLKSSRHYKCVVAVPYHWNGADTANVMQLNITVFSTQVNHTLGDTNVSTTVNPPGIPMPADGAVTALTVDVDM